MFSRWAEAQGDELMNRTHLDFDEVFGAGYADRMYDLLRYFVKLLGCRLASDENGFPLPAELVQALSRDDLTPFGVSFSLNPSYLGVLKPGLKPGLRARGIAGNYTLWSSYSRTTGKINETYVSGAMVGCLDVLYRYDWPECFPWEGELLHAPKKLVTLGRFDPKSSDEHLFPPLPDDLLAEIDGRQPGEV
jgi:hypothetical protein